MLLDASLFNTQHYEVGSVVKWGNQGKWFPSSLHLGREDIEKEPLSHPLLRSPILLTYVYNWSRLRTTNVNKYTEKMVSHKKDQKTDDIEQIPWQMQITLMI